LGLEFTVLGRGLPRRKLTLLGLDAPTPAVHVGRSSSLSESESVIELSVSISAMRRRRLSKVKAWPRMKRRLRSGRSAAICSLQRAVWARE